MKIAIQKNHGWQAPESGTRPISTETQMLALRLHGKDTEHSLLLAQDLFASCRLVMRLPGKMDCILAVEELTEQKGRSLVVSYLENRAAFIDIATAISEEVIDWSRVTAAIEAMTELSGVEAKVPPMSPAYLYGNYVSNPACLQRAVEFLRTRRLSVGEGVKVVISDHAYFNKGGQENIMISATARTEEPRGVDMLTVAKGALATTAALAATWGVYKLFKRKR